MKKIIDWFKDSNRWLHFIGGFLVGAGSSSTYCAAYAGIGVAGALEFKDKQHGDSWDWIDFGITVAGVAVGYLSKLAIKSFIS
jgi:drug/metabolite transporter superfamily protein YnfA